jgi:hypothetical protein
MGERIIDAPGRRRQALEACMSRCALLQAGLENQDFSEEIAYKFREARAAFEEAGRTRGRVKLLVERSDQHPRDRFIAASAIRQFLTSQRLLARFYEQSAYSPFPNPEALDDPTAAAIWCVEITPPGSEVRLNYKYAPSQEGDGWENALLAIHRRSERQWVLAPEEVVRLRAHSLGGQQ